MPKTLTLELPDKVYKELEMEAHARGIRLDQLVIERLAQVVGIEEDSLDKLIGSIESSLTDIAEHHDRYIAQAVLEEMRR